MSPQLTAPTALEEMRAHTAELCVLLADIRTTHQAWACHRLLSDGQRATSGRIAVEAGIANARLRGGA